MTDLPDLEELDQFDLLDPAQMDVAEGFKVARASMLSTTGDHQSIAIVQLDTEAGRRWLALSASQATVLGCLLLDAVPDD